MIHHKLPVDNKYQNFKNDKQLISCQQALHCPPDAVDDLEAAQQCIFDSAQPLVPVLVSRIKDKAEQWARAGARGLRVILPTTWDVH